MASSSNSKGKGRKKTIMEKIQNSSNLQVTFSKRRHGVVKKAHELSVLTRAEVASIVFSPGRKVYTYGHPTIDSVVHRFVTGIPQPLTLAQQIAQNEKDAKVIQIHTEVAKVQGDMEYEKIRIEGVKKYWAQCQINQVGNINWDEQDPTQIQLLIEAIKNTKARADGELNPNVYAQQNNLPLAAGNELLYSSRLGFSGNGGGSSSNSQHNLIGGNDGANVTFNAGLSSFTGGVGVLPNTYMGSYYGVGASNLGLSYGDVPDQDLQSVGPITYVGGGSTDGLQNNFVASSSEVMDGDGGLTTTYMGSSTGVSGYGIDLSSGGIQNQYGQFVGPNYSGNGGSGFPFPYTNGTSSSVLGNSDSGYGTSSNSYVASSTGVSDGDIGLSFNAFPNQLGQFVGSNTYIIGGSFDGLPKNYETSSSIVRNNNGGYDGLPNTYIASSSGADGSGIGRSFSDFPNPQREFLGPNYTNVEGGNGNGLSNTYEASSSGQGKGYGRFKDRLAE